jgi:N utilization substance protein A
MDITLSNEEMRFIAVAEGYIKTRIIDCLNDPQRLTFVVEKGKLGKAIGKNAKNLTQLQKLFKKDVKFVEFDDHKEQFIKNLFKPYQLTNIEIINQRIQVEVKPSDKGKAIGKNGHNINIIRQIAKRHHEIEQLKVL